MKRNSACINANGCNGRTMERKYTTLGSPVVRKWFAHVPQTLSGAWHRIGTDVSGRVLLLLAVPIVIFIYILYLALKTTWTDRTAYLLPVNSECRLPDLDAFDPEVMKYVMRYPPLNCTKQPYLAFIDDAGFLHINDSALEELKNTTTHVSCVYYPITRREENDNTIKVWKQQPLEQGIPMQIFVEVVKVVCRDAADSVIYHEVLNYVPAPTDQLRKRNKKLVKEGRPNIMLLGFDSVSRLNFMRQLPKTYRFLTETLNSTVLKGLTKVGDNTHPNMFAFLSGVTHGSPRADVPEPFWDVDHPKLWSGRKDNLEAPVWWKTVKQQGYISMYLDDSSGHANYNIKPTDYYGKPFYLALDVGDLSKENIPDSTVLEIFEVNFYTAKYFCKGNYPVQVLQFDYIRRFVEKMRESVYFAFPFLVRLSHDNVNSVQVIDDDVATMLQRLHSGGDLNNTVLIVFSDHGVRFGPIMDSVFGQIEGKMPFMSIYLPPSMKEKPHLQAGLESNSERLLSWFDMHELVMDLVMDNLEPESRVTRWAHNGLSPFRDIPRNRTCYDAAIPTEYCVCLQPVPLKVTDAAVQVAVAELMHHVNNMLSVARPACATLTLRHVQSAELLSHPLDPVTLVRVGFYVDPNGAHLQGIVERRSNMDNVTVVGEVERLNKYGNQSDCVRHLEDRRLLLYCFCQNQYYTR